MTEVANTNYTKLCELCHIAQAALYCPSDAAFLCYLCDVKVHSANFLVARHLRYSLQRPAHSCNSSSSTCTQSSTSQKKINYLDRHYYIGQVISSTTRPVSQTRSKVLKTGEGVFLHWCNKLGVLMYDEESRVVVRGARDALAVCIDRLRGRLPPFRVCLAACLWFSLRLKTCSSTGRSVKNVEQMSGVPAKLILATELKLKRLMKANYKPGRCPQVLEEGWDETSP